MFGNYLEKHISSQEYQVTPTVKTRVENVKMRSREKHDSNKAFDSET